jgi:hypothetical protein
MLRKVKNFPSGVTNNRNHCAYQEETDLETQVIDHYMQAVGTPFAEILERARARQRQMEQANDKD